jgi:HlyD family secretion protein
METELKSLRIDRSAKRASGEPSPWATRWIISGVVLLVLLGMGRFVYGKLNAAVEVDTIRVKSAATAGSQPGNTVILNATGYIIAAHKIQVASKVLGRVAWIGVEKGDKVREGQVIVRLEDDEYRAQLQQATGSLQALQARLKEFENGSRPEEISRAEADLAVSRSDLEIARVSLDRTQQLSQQGVSSKQSFDDAKARYDSQVARVNALEKSFQLVRIGPRVEQVEAIRGQIVQARGAVDFAQTQLSNTVIKAPVGGTILERAVEKGEFVTTSFVGERGAKGYVVSLADLNDLQVELDINQNDFAKLGPKQRGIINTDAYPDKKYEGTIYEVSPEANRQKATVQVKVKVLNPDDFLRPEMNASVAFYNEEKAASSVTTTTAAKPVVFVPPAAVKGDSVFVVFQGKAVKRVVKTGSVTAQGIRVEDGLIGGEDLIVNPPADLKDGDKVQAK